MNSSWFRFLPVILAALAWLAMPIDRAAAVPAPAPSPVRITEFMADNRQTIADGNRQYSDWIEIYNAGDTAINLGGWSLTDDPANLRKWIFPDRALGGGEFLLIFASGLGVPDVSGYLHTNFKLADAGSYLALVQADGSTIASAFAPAYPPQRPDISFGVAHENIMTALVSNASPARLRVPVIADAALTALWTGGAEPFDDAAWAPGPAASGFETSDGSSTNNIALGQPVFAAGDTWPGLPKENLTDGSLNTVTHNLDQVRTFSFVVDLGATYALTSVELFNRADGCCPERLANYTVSIHADAGPNIGPATWTANVRTNGSNSGVGGRDLVTAELDPGGVFAGRWIRVQARDDGTPRYLQIAEVRAFGARSASGYRPYLRRDLAATMKSVNASAWLRMPFIASEVFDQVTLRLRYDDGFVAYVNGVEVARRNAPAGQPGWNGSATASHAGTNEEIFTVPGGAAVAGANLLAIHGLNIAANDEDFLFSPTLEGRRTRWGTPGYFTAPTPGTANGTESIAGFVGDTHFSVDRGFFDTPIDVVLSCDTPGSTLVYTTDNSVPGLTNGVVVPAADAASTPATTVHIVTTTVIRAAAFKPGHEPSDVDTHTYLFLRDVVAQPAAPPGLPTVWSGSPADYAMDPKVVTNALYRDEIIADLRSIPTMSIVLPTPDLFGPVGGIYYNAHMVGDLWERAASVEFIRPDGSTGFQENCGLRIWGTGWRPNATTPKHALQVKFKNRYGAGRLRYPLFPDAPVAEFDNLVLRAQGSRGWTDFRQPDIEQSQYIHDGWARDTARAMHKVDGHATYVHLYLNGLYWGLYNPVEKTDEGFAEIYYGGDKSEYDVITRRGVPEVDAGSLDAWNQLMTIVNGGLASPEQYALVQQYLDVDDFIDYMMLQQYASNHDGPLSTIANNMRAIRRRAPGEPFRFYVWDMEYTFWYPQEFNLAFDLDQCPARIFQRLRANPDFRLRWADHAQRHLRNNGALTAGPAAARWQARAQELAGAIVGESARWGDVRRNPPYTRDVEWTNELNRLLYEYFPVRDEILLNQYRLGGLYPAVEPPAFSETAGDVPPGSSVTIDAPEGTVYYTVDGTDPRAPGGAVSPNAMAVPPTSVLVATSSVVRLLVPTDDALGAAWRSPTFDDATWLAGPNAAGFDVTAAPVPDAVALQNASADFSETSRGVNLAIDAQPFTTGWGIFENQSYLPKGRGAVAVFETVDDVGYAQGTRLVFTLRHGLPGQLALGKFRLSTTLDHRSLFADGRTARGDIVADWVPLHPLAATAAGGATVTINADGSLLVGGSSPTTNTYVITVITSLLGMKGFRLEALEDGSLPSNGPGRSGNGNAVLTDFVVQSAPATLSHLVNGTLAAALQPALLNLRTSAYLRAPFNVEPGRTFDRLRLRIRHQDGFVAYLDGQEIARRNAPEALAWNSAAAAERAKGLALEAEEIDVTPAKDLLTAGPHVLAVHGLKASVTSPDFLIVPELIGKTDRAVPVDDTLTLKARALVGLQWSALQEATFAARSPLRLTEIMYDPPGEPGLSGDEFEFLELQNTGSSAYSLSGFTFTSGINFTFTNGTVLAPGQFFLLARNPTAIAMRYPGAIVHGVYTGKLDNQGETLTISRPFNGGIVLSLTYDTTAEWPQATRGLGFSLVPAPATNGNTSSRGASWRASAVPLGSPGASDPAAAIPPIQINEILAASTPPQTDWIELHNPTLAPVDLAGWFLTDDPSEPKKFRLPAGTRIAPDGYLVFTEADFNAGATATTRFNLSSHGESVFLFSGDSQTNLTGYSHGFDFGPSADGVTLGRHVNSVGEEQFPALSSATTNRPNTSPRVGPVVISEVHYHPRPGDDEFLELRNITVSPVDLFDPAHPTNTWIVNGIGFEFPTNVTLPPNGLVLLAGISPAIFRAKYHVPENVAVFGPYSGALQQDGERLELRRPDVPDTNGLFHIAVDSVRYNDRAPWPIFADGAGPSLQRRLASAYGDDPSNWVAAAPSPGSFLPGAVPPRLTAGPANQSVPRHGLVTFTVAADGDAPLRFQWRHNGTNLPGATNAALTLSDVDFAQAGTYGVVVYNAAGTIESSAAVLSVFQAATIVVPPQSLNVLPGSNALFSVYATSTRPIAYQWLFNGSPIPNATNPTLLVPAAGAANVGSYAVRVDDGVVTVTSPPALLQLLFNPVIVQPPLSQTVAAGSSVILSVTVTNAATRPIGYRWRRGSVPLDVQVLNDIVSFFTVTNAQATANYTVVVTNAAQTVGFLSPIATITVVPDSDRDGLPDEWEVAHGLNPNDPADAGLDSDADTMSNRAEYVAGTDPQDRNSYLKVDAITATSPARLRFGAVSNRTYVIEFSDSFGSPNWTRLAEIAATSTNRIETVPDPTPGPTRVYRLVTPRLAR